MAEPSRWKLGLAVASSAVGAYVGLMALAAHLKAAEPLIAITYLDESVQGLRENAKVQMRGVTIGRVKAFGLAEDSRHVEVLCELDERTLRMLGIRDVHARWGEGEFTPPSLRAFLASSGLTGVLSIQMDFFDPVKNPLPKLGFDPPWNYVPAVESFQKTIQHDLPAVLANLPARLDRADEVLTEVDDALTELDLPSISRQTRADFAAATDSLEAVDVAEISSEALGFLETTAESLRAATASLDEAGSDEELERLVSGILTAADNTESAIRAFRGDDEFGKLRGTAASLTQMAKEMSAALSAMRGGVNSMQRAANGLDGTLRPLGEDPSATFFEKDPRAPPD